MLLTGAALVHTIGAMDSRGPVLLARYLALAWLGLVIYGSLHPFSGWRDTGVSAFAFLEGVWPRYWTTFDLATNVAVYLPLGFLLTLALRGLPGRFTAPLLAVLLSATVSLVLETLQTWLPSRVPSNVDLACNALGSLFGGPQGWRTRPGAAQRPSAASGRGRYKRRFMLKGPAGAGSQLASLSLPGEACWMWMSSEPSAL